MGLFDKLKGVFGGKKEEGEGAGDAPDAPDAKSSQRREAPRKSFSLSTGQVYRPASERTSPVHDTETLPLPDELDAAAPQEAEGAPSIEAIDFDLAAPSSLDETADSSAEQPAAGSRSMVGKPAPNVTARMVAVGKATPGEAEASRGAASPSLRAAIAGASVSHKRRVSAKSKMLGQVLIDAHALDEDRLEQALEKQRREGGLLGQLLRAAGLANEEAVCEALKKQRTITTVTLAKANIDMDVVKILDKEFCLKHRLLPFERFGNLLCIAMTNVLDTQAKNLVRERSNMLVKPFDVEWADLSAQIERVYARPGERSVSRRSSALTARIESGAVSSALAAAETVGSTEMFTLLPTKPLPAVPLAAIPMGEAFASEVVQWDAADPERRWMATQLADNRLPLLPPMDAS